MKILYLANVYPAPSSTFIRDELIEIEKLGHQVARFSVRTFRGQLVDPLDIAEARKTRYLLDGNVINLFLALARELVLRPAAVLGLAPLWMTLLRRSRGGIVRHVAYALQAIQLRQLSAKMGTEHIHVHFSTNATAVAMLCKCLGGPSYSFTAHGPDEFRNPSTNSFPEKIANSSFVVAISDYSKALLDGFAKPAQRHPPITVIRCGIDLERFAVSPPIAPETMTFVCVGRLCPQKGQIHIPKAISELRQEFPGVRIVLVGDGESRKSIEKEIAAHGVEQQVILMGWGSGAKVKEMIATSRALVLPSYAEGLPIAIMEALAMGRAVISTRIAGIPELVDPSCGWLADPGDVDGLVAAMRAALLASPDTLQTMGLAGRRRVERLHDRRQLAVALADMMGRFASRPAGESAPRTDLSASPTEGTFR